MLNKIKVVAVTMLVASASSAAVAKTHKVHHRAPAYDAARQVTPNGFGYGADYPWLGAPYDGQRLPSQISTLIF